MQKSYRVRERMHENLTEHLLLSRGILEQDFNTFLEPDFLRDSHDPFLLPGMDAAVDRILAAVKNNEMVCVWSDYDADGVPGGVMLADFLRALGLFVIHYIPHRHKEGYGLNEEGINEIALQKVSLMITVDLGTTEVDAIAYAKTKGIDTIVTDHHLEPEVLPKAVAILNPKLSASKYPFDGLCGSGVAWKLVQAILSKNRPDGFAEGREKWYLDLVGLATLSDMVPLVGENRMLAHFGLTVMRRGRRPGLKSLLDLLRIKPATLTEDDIGFMISPRLNAASRMGEPRTAARLLDEKDPAAALLFAKELQALNDQRKTLVASTVKEVNKRLQSTEEQNVIVMGNPSWRPGILGLVAGKLADEKGKPVFLWGRDSEWNAGGNDELLRGSCRSGGGANVVELMHAAGDIFEHKGGHAASGGFALRQERAHELPTRLMEAYKKIAAQKAFAQEVVLDRELGLAEVPHAHRQLTKLAPFGTGFTKPLFIFPGLFIAQVRTFGKAQDHLEIALAKEGEHVAGIAFFSTPESFNKKISVGERADVVGNVELDWRGNPRLRVVDVI